MCVCVFSESELHTCTSTGFLFPLRKVSIIKVIKNIYRIQESSKHVCEEVEQTNIVKKFSVLFSIPFPYSDIPEFSQLSHDIKQGNMSDTVMI
jgi:hypothetical protein